jgi:hypothetical protein
MKMKLFLFLGLIIGSISLSVFFSNDTFAANENYKWISATTIEGSGGGYSDKIKKNIPSGTSTQAVPVGTVRYERVGTTNVFKAVAGNIFYTTGGVVTGTTMCNLQPSLTVNSGNVAGAALKVNEDGQPTCDQSGLTATVALADTANAPDPSSFAATPGVGGADATPSMCGVKGIGWFICPIANSIADGIHAVFGMVEQLLIFKSYTTDKENGIYPAWAIMRNLANVAFVVAFMIIIYSQLTSMGISNYGIKKMLPRLIVAAILVNASYWICGIAVDISNILGASVNDLFASMIPAIRGDRIDVSWQDATLTILSGTAIGGVAAYTALAAAGGFGAFLWLLVPVLLSAVFAILVAIIILAGRQVILIILIVISPLAFVAYLLPNTSKWYSKWQSAFFTLLLMYPIIALIFSGSQLASAIIMSADDLSMVMLLLALAAQVVPLAITPLVMKLSSGVLGRFAGVVNNPKRGPFDAIKTRAKEKQELATKRGLDPNNTGFVNRMGQKRAFSRRREKLQGEVHESAADASWAGKTVVDPELQALVQQKQSNAIASNVASGVNNKLTTRSLANNGPGQIESALNGAANNEDIQAQIKVAVDEATAKSIAEVEVSTKAEINPGDMVAMGKAFADAIKAGDSISARAVQNILLTSGGSGISTYRGVMSQDDVEDKLNEPGSDAVSKDLRKNMLNKHGNIKAAANDLIEQAVTGQTMKQASASAKSWVMPDEDLVHQKPASIELALPHIDQAQAARIISNEELAKNLTAPLRAEFHRISGIAPPQPQTASATPASTNIPPQPNQASTTTAPPQPTQSPTAYTSSQPTQTPTTVNVQPGTLNIQHNMPPNANPANYRTSMPPNTTSYTPSAGGIYNPYGNQTPPSSIPQPPPNPPQPPSNP